MFFDSNTNTDIQLSDIKSKLFGIGTDLVMLKILFFESERNRVGLTSDEDYKKWLNDIEKPTWDSIKNYIKNNGGTKS